jgi:hypothetical protein
MDEGDVNGMNDEVDGSRLQENQDHSNNATDSNEKRKLSEESMLFPRMERQSTPDARNRTGAGERKEKAISRD